LGYKLSASSYHCYSYSVLVLVQFRHSAATIAHTLSSHPRDRQALTGCRTVNVTTTHAAQTHSTVIDAGAGTTKCSNASTVVFYNIYKN
jgi:hypothetical protein